METQTNSNNEEKKVFMKYKLIVNSRDVNRGGLVSIEDVAKAYLQHHGYGCKTHRHYGGTKEVIVEFIYKGQDPALKSFSSHVNLSGRVPKALRGKIEVLPLPWGENIEIKTDDIAYQRTIKALNNKLIEYEKTIKDLEKDNREISTKASNVASLEKKLEQFNSMISNDSLKTLVNTTYVLNNPKDRLMEASTEWGCLSEEDQDIFINNYKDGLNFVDYVQLKTELRFSSENEIEQKMSKISCCTNFEDTSYYNYLNKKGKELETVKNVLVYAQKQGANKTTLDFLTKNVNEFSSKFKDFDTQIEKGRQEFSKFKELLGRIEELRGGYSVLDEVINNSNERRKKNTQLNMIVAFHTNNKLELYTPRFDEGSKLEEHMNKLTKQSLPENLFNKEIITGENYTFIRATPHKKLMVINENKPIYKFKKKAFMNQVAKKITNNSVLSVGAVFENLNKCYRDHLCNDPVFNALGFTSQLTVISKTD